VLLVSDRPAPERVGNGKGAHRLYNIGNNRPEDLLRMIDVLEAAIGRPAQKLLLPLQPGDVPETYADIDAIRRDYGFQPTTSIETGLPEFVAWFKRYHGLPT
jgi:UDP-glucuronate 4-epimerase